MRALCALSRDVWVMGACGSLSLSLSGVAHSGGRRADMRKAMSRDVYKKSVIPLTRPVHPHELEED